MIIELERQRAPVVVVSHQVSLLNMKLKSHPKMALYFRVLKCCYYGTVLQAVLRALYAYFADRPLQEIPHIEVI